MWRSGVCTGKDTGIKQTEREIAAWLLVIKNKPGYGQKKEGGYAQNEKKKPSCGRCKKHLTKPSAFESEIHPSHKLRLCSVYFALAGGLAAERQRVRKQAPERLLTKKDGVAYSEKFIYSVIEAAKRKGQD